MEGLSLPAKQIIEKFSTIDYLKEYQLVGGTAIALQIQHRLSDDLDFCKWVSDPETPQGAVDPNALEEELTKRFGTIQRNHLGFSQVNFYILNPGVKISYYHTGLTKPQEPPTPIIGNIYASDLKVLGGSKLFVINKRTQIRDYYDIYVLIKNNVLTIDEMIVRASMMDRSITPKNIYAALHKTQFTDRSVEKELNHLEPKYPVSANEMNSFFKEIAAQIEAKYLRPRGTAHRV